MVSGGPLAARVGALEGKVESPELLRKEPGKALEPHFREQAELIDGLFIVRFEEWDKRWDRKFEQKPGSLEENLEARLLQPLRDDLVVVREGIKILLKRRR